MRSFFLAAVLVLMASGAQASSYLRLDGVTVDPIQSETPVGDHPYSGTNLEPGVWAPHAQLVEADLTNADLSGAYLRGALLSSSNLNAGV